MLSAVLLGSAGRAEAQVGLASREIRIQLVAHVPAGASMQSVSSPRLLDDRGRVRKAAVSIRVAATSEYRLLVHGTAQPVTSAQHGRIWVQGADGRFHELRENSPVVVAHDQPHAGELARDVVYRFETSEPASGIVSLPVRYEILVNPTL